MTRRIPGRHIGNLIQSLYIVCTACLVHLEVHTEIPITQDRGREISKKPNLLFLVAAIYTRICVSPWSDFHIDIRVVRNGLYSCLGRDASGCWSHCDVGNAAED